MNVLGIIVPQSHGGFLIEPCFQMCSNKKRKKMSAYIILRIEKKENICEHNLRMCIADPSCVWS